MQHFTRARNLGTKPLEWRRLDDACVSVWETEGGQRRRRVQAAGRGQRSISKCLVDSRGEQQLQRVKTEREYVQVAIWTMERPVRVCIDTAECYAAAAVPAPATTNRIQHLLGRDQGGRAPTIAGILQYNQCWLSIGLASNCFAAKCRYRGAHR